MADKTYNADDLKILEGLEAVRVRPGMYIGSTGVKGLHHILWEIVDNSVDEAANGYADEITVVCTRTGRLRCATTAGVCPPTSTAKLK